MRTTPNQAHYRVFTEDGRGKDTAEAGHWGVSGLVYFSVNRATRLIDGRFRDTDPADLKYYNTYWVFELISYVFRYKHAETNDQFKNKRR